MNKPLVSILLPIATNSPFLVTTLTSLVSQDYKNLEYVIIINHGDDDILTVVHTILKESVVKTVRVDNDCNFSQMLNEGIENCKGIYIARADADDIYPSNRISLQLEFLENSNPEIAIVSGQGNLIDSHGVVFGRITVPTSYENVETRLLFKNCLIHPAVMMRREAALEFIYDSRLKTGEDYDLWLRMGSKYKLANLDVTLINYRVHSGNSGKHRILNSNLQQLARRKWQYGRHKNFGYPLIFFAVVSWSIKNLFFSPQFFLQMRRKISSYFVDK